MPKFRTVRDLPDWEKLVAEALDRKLAEGRELHRPKDLQEPGEDDYLLTTEDHTGEEVD